jgi:hypothetical protein
MDEPTLVLAGDAAGPRLGTVIDDPIKGKAEPNIPEFWKKHQIAWTRWRTGQ